MIVMGIDPGIANVGFGVIEKRNKTLSVIVSGCLTTTPRRSQTRRIYSIARRIKRLIEATEPDTIVIEDFIPFKQRKNMGHISQAYGAIQYVCEDSSAEVHIVRPNVWMRRLLGLTKKARFSKLAIRRIVNKTLNIRTDIEHESEALGMALYFIQRRDR